MSTHILQPHPRHTFRKQSGSIYSSFFALLQGTSPADSRADLENRTEEIRAHMMDSLGLHINKYPHLARRMLFVTGDTLSPGARQFLDETGCPHLDKPFNRADLLARLARVLQAPHPDA